jgi:hypothetical protein
MSVVLPIVIVAVIVGVGAIAYGGYLAEKKRIEDLQRVAAELGFDFERVGQADFLQSLSHFNLFTPGHSKSITNLMRGRTQDLDAAIFDYRYVTGHGKHRHVSNHSVICFRFEGPELPRFGLCPENFTHRIGQWFGYQDIDFETHATFSDKYLLRGRDEQAVRGLFTGTVLDYFEDKPGLSAEGAGNTLLFYRHATRVRPENIRSFLEEGFAVLGLFRRAE